MIRTTGKMVFLLGLGALITSGCGGGADSKQAVSGTINFKGKPLDQGAVIFIPQNGSEKAITRTAIIENGKFAIPAKDGLVPGTYNVRITSGEGGKQVDPTEPPGESGPPPKERIPAKYNEFSKITFEVKSGQANVFTQDIP